MKWRVRSVLGVTLACGWVALACAETFPFTPDNYRPATVRQLAQPRATPGKHVARTTFPAARREAGAETKRAVQAWIERQGLAPQLARFMTHEYQVDGTWIVFLEWADLRQVLKPGEPVRLYLHDIGMSSAAPLMAALFVHQGWPEAGISELDDAILAYFTSHNLVAEADQGKIAAHLGISRAELAAALASLRLRKLVQRGKTGERDEPGWYLALSAQGHQAYGKTRDKDVLGISGWLKFDGSAQRLLEKIQGCLRAHAAQKGAAGFPLQLAQLGPAGSRCLAEPETGDMADGYRFSYFPGAPDPAGRVHIYVLCADPVLFSGTGFTTHGADEQDPQVGRFFVTGKQLARPSACGRTGRMGFDHIKHCLVTSAAANPLQGYPADLTPMGPQGNGCLAAAGASRLARDWFFPNKVITSDNRHYEYFPGKPLADARIASFEPRSGTRYILSDVEEMMTSEGTFHAAERRTPTRADPTPVALRRQIDQRVKSDEENMKVLDRRCAEGSMADCGELAHREHAWSKYDRTRELWDRACAGGHDESCLFSPKFVAEIVARWKKSCDLNERLGCETYNQHQYVSSQAQTLKRQCERQEEGACARLAEMAAQVRHGGRLLPLPKYQSLDRFAPPGYRP